MENDGMLDRVWRSISDKLQDQVWFQQIRSKWDELDARTKTFLKYGSLIGGSALGVVLVGTNLMAVADKKKEIDEKTALIHKIQGSQDELRRLKEVTSRFNGADGGPWSQFLQDKAQAAGFDPSAVTVGAENVVASAKKEAPKAKDPKDKAAPTAANDAPEEAIIDVGLKHINVRQLVKYVHEVENGGRTVKVRKLQVDTAPDESGYLDANLVVSAFRLKQ